MIGQMIKELRKERGLSQEVLATALNISRATLANYELNNRQVPIELVPQFANFFGVKIDVLFGRDN